jgi:hypothetical protein
MDHCNITVTLFGYMPSSRPSRFSTRVMVVEDAHQETSKSNTNQQKLHIVDFFSAPLALYPGLIVVLLKLFSLLFSTTVLLLNV